MGQHWQEIVPIDRYIVVANGLLHEYDRKVLVFLYQPLIGSTCFSLYMTLWGELEENTLWSRFSSHHLLMNLMGKNLKDIYEARVKLEGMGLLKTFVKEEEEGRSFIYELQPPLTPEQFFLDGMLNIYLYRKIGKNHYNRLKQFFSIQKKPEDEYQEVTKPFQDVFESISPLSLQYSQGSQENFELDSSKAFIGRGEQKEIQIDANLFNFDLLLAGLNESLVPKKAFTKKVKDAISNLSFLYHLDPIEMKNIILGVIGADNEINIEELRKAARDWYQIENAGQMPSLIERSQPLAYQTQQAAPKSQEERLVQYLESNSPLKILRDLAGGVEPSNSDIQIIEDVMFKQKLLPGVINVLIQFVMLRTDMKLSKGYVEKIAGHWARKQVKTVKEAMDLAKNEHRTYLDWSKNKKNSRAPQRKPIRTELLPDWFDEEETKHAEKQPEKNDREIETKKKEIEQKLKAFRDRK